MDLEQLKKHGVNIRKLSEELGYSPNFLSSAIHRRGNISRSSDLLRKLRQKAQILKRYSHKTHSLDYVCRKGLIKQSHIARKVGVSRQAVNLFDTKLSEEKRSQISEAVRDIGKALELIADKVEKKSN